MTSRPVNPVLDDEIREVAAHELLTNNAEWQGLREGALQEANIQRVLDFPDYENITAVSTTMKMIFPFWGYESHRWGWWLPRELIRHPGVGLGWGKYQNNSDSGYIDVPGPLDINPLRGTVFMGGFRRLAQRDFPEFYDNFEGMSEFFDYTSRFGFYPGAPVGALMSVFGAAAWRPAAWRDCSTCWTVFARIIGSYCLLIHRPRCC